MPEADNMLKINSFGLVSVWMGDLLVAHICHVEFHNGKGIGYKCNEMK